MSDILSDDEKVEDLLFQFSADLFCIARNGYFTEVNPAWTRSLGWSRSEMLERPFIDFVHPEDRERTVNVYRWCQEGQEVRHFENRYRTKEGDYRWLQWNTRPIKGGDTGVARDVTEQKEHEFLLQQSRRQLQFLHFLVENTYDPVYVISPRENFRMKYVNEAACQHYGMSREALLQLTIPEWDPLYDLEKCQLLWEELKTVKRRVFESQHKVREGRVTTVEITASYLEFNGEEYIAGTIRDISRRKHAEQNLERFAYAVSHDLQEPLRTIASFLQLLQRKTANSPELAEYIAFATEGAARMRSLIQALLDYSRVGTESTKIVPTHLDRIIDNVTKNLHRRIIESETAITKEGLSEVMCDPVLIEQLFQNLIDNAMKYRSASPPRIHISLETFPTNWHVKIKDNGIGIAASEQNRIFEVFQRLHSRHEYSGAGVGLATCKRVVDLHGGKIWVTSIPGEGSTFHFTLSRLPVR